MTAIDLPYARLLDVRRLPADKCQGDAPVVAMRSSETVLGRPGFLHGGAIAGLLEYACFMALVDAAGDGAAASRPVTVTIDYLRGGALVETLACAEILRLGKRIAHLEASAWQDDRARPIAAARMNFLLSRDQ